MVMQGKIAEISEMNTSQDIYLELRNKEDLPKVLVAFPDSKNTDARSLILTGKEQRMNEILRFIVEQNIAITKIERMEGNLEKLFLEVVEK